MYAWSPRVHDVGILLDDTAEWADATFLVQGTRRMSYREHAVAVDTAVGVLRGRGLGPGDLVVLFAANHIETVVAWWACIRIGAVPASANGWWSATEVAEVLAELRPPLVIADQSRRARLDPAVQVLELESLLAGGSSAAPGAAPERASDEDGPAAVLFTSGTTGTPRGVELSHRAVIANLHNLLHASHRLPTGLARTPVSDVNLLGVPLFHMSGMQTMLLTIATGGRLVLREPGPFDASALMHLIEQERITSLGLVPTMLRRLLLHPDLASFDLGSVRAVTTGGMPVEPALIGAVREHFPSVAGRVGTMYGLTESGGAITRLSGADLAARPWSAGPPLSVVELSIDDPDDAGVGEILVRSPANMTGYLGVAPERPIDDLGWLHTGDLGRLEGDELVIVGRSKDVIIRAGENIAAPRVEACLATHPGVAEVAVLGLADEDLGERVAAVVVALPGATVGTEELRALAADRLASFEVPTDWWVRTEGLPTNATGKILKAVLREAWGQRRDTAESELHATSPAASTAGSAVSPASQRIDQEMTPLRDTQLIAPPAGNAEQALATTERRW
jgi:long-chain acyl-CoA synthetase